MGRDVPLHVPAHGDEMNGKIDTSWIGGLGKDELKTALSAEYIEKKQLEAENKEIRAENADLRNRLKKDGMIIFESVEQIKELKEQLIENDVPIRERLDVCRKQKQKLEAENKELKEQNNQLIKDDTDMTNQIAELKKQNENIKRDALCQTHCLIEAEQNNDELKARWEELQQRVEDLRLGCGNPHYNHAYNKIIDFMQQLKFGGEVPAVSMGRCETVSKETKGALKPAEATKYRRVPSYCRNGKKIRGYIIKIKPQGKCVICGDKGIFQIGSGQTATLNGTDYTRIIEAHYKKGEWLCEDCLFK